MDYGAYPGQNDWDSGYGKAVEVSPSVRISVLVLVTEAELDELSRKIDAYIGHDLLDSWKGGRRESRY